MQVAPLVHPQFLPSFPIVGIGASAGGLEAITDLVSKIPGDCGMAFLVVQHLDPQRPSLLSDILALRTALQVSVAVEGMEVQVNHLYVIPPNTSMLIEGGRLKLTARGLTLGPPTPIDDLFESLAKDQGANGIGIILSGNGSDGAIGLQTLHNVGAITFAQDESARYPSMPRTVRGLGCVDLVLPPEGIANELLRLALHSYLGAGEPARGKQDQQIDEDELRQIFQVLKRECNIDFGNYKRGTIYRRVARRLALRNIGSIRQYIGLLGDDAEEVRALCRDLLIRFTEFFRDPETFAILTASIFARFAAAGSADDPIRIWVAGCASGEEVYSIAIALLEYLSAHSIHRSVQIFGTDISEDALETARAGRYIENIARNVSAERLQRFFVRDDDYYRVSRSVRDCCTFAQQNVAHDPPFSRMDLITCRNLLIYLDPSLQRRVIPLLHYALKPQGVLMLGLSESVGSTSELFTALGDQRHRFFCKKVVPGRPHGMPMLDFQPRNKRTARVPGVASLSSDDRFRKQVDRVALETYAPPAVLCDEEMNIVEFRGDTSAYLLNRPGVPTTQLRNLARPGLLVAITEAFQLARQEKLSVIREGLRVDTPHGIYEASIRVVPVPSLAGDEQCFLVFFIGHPLSTSLIQSRPSSLWALLKTRLGWRGSHADPLKLNENQSEVERLVEELRATRAHMTTIVDEHEVAIQELKSSEEEMLSSNEEFQSTNEELETAKEELQSLNEELSTTNDELGYRNRELKGKNELIVEARDYANAIVETTSEPMLVLDADFRVVRANRAYYECFHVLPIETLQMGFYSLGNGQWDRPELRQLLNDLSPEQNRVSDFTLSSNFPKIGRRTVCLNAVHLAWADHPLILLTVQDTTDRYSALDALHEADRRKDEFLAMLGHELRNPLAAMRNALDLWKISDGKSQSQEFVISVFERQVTNQARLVEDLLDVSRISRGHVGLQIQEFDLGLVVRNTFDSINLKIQAQQLIATITLPAEPLVIKGDPMRLEQVVVNILGNAMKYTPPQGRIDIRLERDNEEAVLTMTDSGIGLAAEFIPVMFDVFVQARRSVDTHTGGMGIGLSLVRRLLNLHGGTVKAESEGLGKGTKITIRLPALPLTKVAYESIQALPASVLAMGSRILLVDDNFDVLDAGAELLRAYGHDVRTAISGVDALDCVKTFTPDIVLLDIGMPGMDGYEVCRRLRQTPGFEKTVIIANSGYGLGKEQDLSRDVGFDRYLVKPINLANVANLAQDIRNSRIEDAPTIETT